MVFAVKKQSVSEQISQAERPRWFNRLEAELRVRLECFDICFDIRIANVWIMIA